MSRGFYAAFAVTAALFSAVIAFGGGISALSILPGGALIALFIILTWPREK